MKRFELARITGTIITISDLKEKIRIAEEKGAIDCEITTRCISFGRDMTPKEILIQEKQFLQEDIDKLDLEIMKLEIQEKIKTPSVKNAIEAEIIGKKLIKDSEEFSELPEGVSKSLLNHKKNG